MKHGILLLILIASITSVSASEEETGFFTHPRYTRKELVAARIVWLKVEDDIDFLKKEAAETIFAEHVCRYVNSYTNYSKLQGEMNDNNQTVCSRIDENKPVTLNYVDFDIFLHDKQLKALAEKKKKLDFEQAIFTSLGKAGLQVFKKLATAVTRAAPDTDFKYDHPLLSIRHDKNLTAAYMDSCLLQTNYRYKLSIEPRKDTITTVVRFEQIL